MTPLPLTVIGGYLGAGKTTLINQLLAADHGLRILVLVNDFGAINIDAGLLISADEDTIELANGCVCCTMGADLFLAVGDALDRRPRPDHLIIEASGIADPARIANVARAEPDLAYSGIATVVDGLQLEDLCHDPLIETQIKSQITCAQQIAVSKSAITPKLRERLTALNPTVQPVTTEQMSVEQLLLTGQERGDTDQGRHPAYSKWSYTGNLSMDHAQLISTLASRPRGLYRLKGQVRGMGDRGYQVQVVGSDMAITDIDQPAKTELVGIGLAARLTPAACDAWWAEQIVQAESRGRVRRTVLSIPTHAR